MNIFLISQIEKNEEQQLFNTCNDIQFICMLCKGIEISSNSPNNWFKKYEQQYKNQQQNLQVLINTDDLC